MTISYENLQQASFRGVPFAVKAMSGDYGRRPALHEYPFADLPWVEDMGRATRRKTLTGFLISNSGIYGGGDVINQIALMIAAVETPGPGTLVHPTLGSLSVSVPNLNIGETVDTGAGSYCELRFTFYESGDRQYPAVSISTDDAVDDAADDADDAVDDDFTDSASNALPWGSEVSQQAATTATNWGQLAITLVADATSVVGITSALVGSFGRFNAGSNATSSTISTATTVSSAIAAAVIAQAGVVSAVETLVTAGAGLDVTTVPTFTSAAQALAAALQGSATDPADTIRLLSQLAVFTSNPIVGIDPIGAAMSTIASASADLFRRSAVIALGRAAATYQPTSSTDAFDVLDEVIAIIDAEIDIAGNQFDDNTFSALQALRLAVIQDLTSRGADLSPIITFTFAGSLPAATLAARIYNDTSRTPQLIAQVEPINPLFMPSQFQALSN